MRIRVWFNLHRKDWSIKRGDAPVAHYPQFALRECRFHVSAAARQKVLDRHVRSVHAWVSGLEDDVELSVMELYQVSYNPYRCGSFYMKQDGREVHQAQAALFAADGTAWAKGAS